MSEKKQAWWISWESTEEMGGFELHTPWWRSGWGYDEDENEFTNLVAAVRADSEDEAFAIVEEAYDIRPEGGVNRRFAKVIDESDTLPWEREGTRFPLGDWMEWN